MTVKMLLAGATAAMVMAGPALADYPTRAVQLVIPYGAGGATDLSARTLANALAPVVEKPLLPVNRTGAGGATGSTAVATAKADGYTMLAARVGSHSVNPAMKATLPYTLDDFRFVAVYEINPVACAVVADSEINTITDLVARVKATPGRISYSSSGVGSLLHIAGALVLKSFGIDNPVEAVIHLPLKGGGAAATAVLSGTADFICTNSSALASFVANKQLKPIMVTTREPVPGFDAPSARALGHPELERLVGWTGIAGPDGLPDAVAAKWTEWLKIAVKDETFLDVMAKRGSIVRLMQPQESLAFINAQYRVFRDLVDQLGMRIE